MTQVNDVVAINYRIGINGYYFQLADEILNLSRRKPDEVVNTEKVERLNQLLEPLKVMLQNEEYAELLEVIPLPEATDGKEKMKGMTYSDLAIILNHYKNLMNRFFRKKF